MSWSHLPYEGFLDRLASSEPTPGGGTASALAGATSCALSEMVLGLTLGRAKYASVQAELEPLLPEARARRAAFLRLADLDSRAYEDFMRAAKLPKGTPEEQSSRQRAMQATAAQAALVPLRTAEEALDALRLAERCAKLGNPNARSDATVAALLAWACFQGARLNVLANLPGCEAKHAEELRARLMPLEASAEQLLAEARL